METTTEASKFLAKAYKQEIQDDDDPPPWEGPSGPPVSIPIDGEKMFVRFDDGNDISYVDLLLRDKSG